MKKQITRDDLIKKESPLIIAGPCAVESKAQIRLIAKKLHKMGITVLRCQLWKPRSDPDSFQGIGLKGLQFLKELKDELGILIATEITDKEQIAQTAGVVDILWVGARNMQNYELLKALGRDKRPVILKRGLICTVDEWLKAGKYIGMEKVILCERGIRTGADSMRFTLDLNSALVAKYDHGMPVIIDPSHTAGRADMVPNLAYAGIAAGMDGIVVEVHHQPERAYSDASQQITPEVFQRLVHDIRALYRLRHKKEDFNIFLESREGFHAVKKKSSVGRTALSLGVYNRVGILKDILSIFADFNIDVDKLKPKRSKNKDLDYFFEFEVNCRADDQKLIQALNILKEYCPVIKVLKEYNE